MTESVNPVEDVKKIIEGFIGTTGSNMGPVVSFITVGSLVQIQNRISCDIITDIWNR